MFAKMITIESQNFRDLHKKSPDMIDLLATSPSTLSFNDRVRELKLSSCLENKALELENKLTSHPHGVRKDSLYLTRENEKELAAEVLLLRHRFTEIVRSSQKFRQAALSIIQNIYLFRNRKIFFGTHFTSPEQERQEALHLFSTSPARTSLSLTNTFQHLIIARVWNRILSQTIAPDQRDEQFMRLHGVVEKLNTIRNIYMILTTGLVKKLAAQINAIYKTSVAYEDALQIGSIGIARAAYRYHHSCGTRFSTYAANWVFKEIQRQSLSGRLIRLSANTVEQYTKAAKQNDSENFSKYSTLIENTTALGREFSEEHTPSPPPEQMGEISPLTRAFESRELQTTLLDAIDKVLSEKNGDIVKRRYGLRPYQGDNQSVISISKIFGVTRGNIYQLEQTALKKLHRHLQSEFI